MYICIYVYVYVYVYVYACVRGVGCLEKRCVCLCVAPLCGHKCPHKEIRKDT